MRERVLALVATLALALVLSGTATAQANPFAPGWQLDAENSTLRFQSVKNETVVESSSFATLSGGIGSSGEATVRVLLDSVDTGIDLRNVRMRFLFFETFQFPEAIVNVGLTPALLSGLQDTRRTIVTVPYTLKLHGIQKAGEADVAVTLLSDDRVSVASTAPISVAAADFDLTDNVGKLEEAAGVDIIPSAAVTFDFAFVRLGAEGEPALVASRAVDNPSATALETQGRFSDAECQDRLITLSRAEEVYFRVGSSRLDQKSDPILRSIVDTIQRCGDARIEISGHTDSDGSDAYNQRLSELRAQSVAAYLTGAGVPDARLEVVGRGESEPRFPNTTKRNKWRNRRIEFSLLQP